jgi:hypothetical protein
MIIGALDTVVAVAVVNTAPALSFENLLHFHGPNAHLGSLKWRRRASFWLRLLSLMPTPAMHAVGTRLTVDGLHLARCQQGSFGAYFNSQVFFKYRTFHTAYHL